MIIGLTGTYCSGKGTIADMLMEKGWGFVSLSELLREEARKQKRSTDRVELGIIGEELKREHGLSVLADRAVEFMRKHPKGNYVIDSIRNTHEVERLRREKDFVLVATDAPIETRWERERRRKREDTTKSIEDFRRKEENESSSNPYFMQLRTCMRMADVLIINDKGKRELAKRIMQLIADHSRKGDEGKRDEGKRDEGKRDR